MAMNNGYELDWDSTIDQDEQQAFTVLDEGDYDFQIDHVDRSIVGDNSEKYSGVKMATVYMNVRVPGQDQEIQLRENFILHSNFEWKIGSLLVCVGLKKKGEAINGNYWNKLPGMRGRCHVVQNASNRNPERKFNNVQTFYEPNSQQDSGGNRWAL